MLSVGYLRIVQELHEVRRQLSELFVVALRRETFDQNMQNGLKKFCGAMPYD